MKAAPGTWPVAVVGGGPAGAATALSLARRGCEVVLLERSAFEAFRPGEALAPFARVLLGQLGIEESVLPELGRPSFAICSAWGSRELTTQHFMTGPYGNGWHVDRRRFDAMLAKVAAAAGATVRLGAKVTAVVPCEGGVKLSIEQGRGEGEGGERGDGGGRGDGGEARGQETLVARVVVDATGRNARVAQALGASRLVYDRLIAVAGVLPPPGDDSRHGDVLLLEGLAEGWFYSVRLPDASLLCAWMTDGDLLERGGRQALACWRSALAASLHTRSRVMSGTGEGAPSGNDSFHEPGLSAPLLHVRAATTSRLDAAAGPGWFAVGDAASAYDPLSAEGVCKALASGQRAAVAVTAWLEGDTSAAPAYAAEVREAFRLYLAERASFYRMETRWPGSPFWQRRRTRTPQPL